MYLLAGKRNGIFYAGNPLGLLKRIWEHKNDAVECFSKHYGIHTLVWYEVHETLPGAIAREKAIKEWKRKWKLQLIEQMNPQWRYLYPDLV